jgi:3-hydroxypropanoate dehydrogenase
MFHNPDAINWFKDKGTHTETTAFRNATLQAGYGLMSGFDSAKVDAAFLPKGRWKSNFLVNMGYGTGKGIAPRNPRPSFEEISRIL